MIGLTFASSKVKRFRITFKRERNKIMTMFGFMALCVVAFAVAATLGIYIDIKVEGNRN